MYDRSNKYILVAGAMLVLVSCGPQKKEEAPLPEQKQTVPMMELKKPEEVPQAHPAQPGKEVPLTPHQKEELEINEDNVMNPIPG